MSDIVAGRWPFILAAGGLLALLVAAPAARAKPEAAGPLAAH